MLVKAEPAPRWWHSKNSFKYSTIIVSHKQFILSQEHQLIALWQPHLNFPFVTKILAPKALGFKRVKLRATLKYSLNAHRLFSRHRKRHLARHCQSPVTFSLGASHNLKIAWDAIF